METQEKKRDRIIIVDDDEDLLNLLTFVLQARGFEIKGLTRGKEALAYLLNEQNISTAALLVLDRNLPDIDGLEILKQFTAKYQKKIPVLILSVLSAEKDIIAGLKGGALEYIPKPFSLPIFIEKALVLIAHGGTA